ncbi:hydrolase [Serpentinicella alkaliphila]|uniref:Nicotinamidase-related amidase n=1 Tax=Serpentinicella alkaliphila TaxID=1734049 RepID=A0A4R2TCC6_9FIRM|nr:hydrolase [Serpentinicella alkaliphila]QUH25396.1 hydrolase [Serpentinicella alkaliphila]TCQ00601.1 nicotinamidase-related amidase [Serpentinicella alkaliphila]
MEKFTLERSDALLLVIDIQERLVAAMKYGDQMIENTKVLVEVAKVMDFPTVVTEQYPKGIGPTVPELASLLDKNMFFEKVTFTGCTEDVVAAIKKLGRKKVIITGTETHVCVLQTTRDLLKLGYEVFIVRDAVCSRSKTNYKAGLELLANMGAVITTTEVVVFDLLKQSATPEFKQISKLIK